MSKFTSIEICAGAGGQALGLEIAGFEHEALVEIDKDACNTLRFNRPTWNVLEKSVKDFTATEFRGVDLFAGGVPCPPFSIAGKQLGFDDERDLFPDAIRLVEECRPKAILLENVKGILSKKFDGYRKQITNKLRELGYEGEWKLIYSSDYGVPQLRPRAIYVGLKDGLFNYFRWPQKNQNKVITVGEALYEEMKSNGWKLAEEWKDGANTIAPTLVGGSKKHGGADLGPTRAKAAWLKLGVNGKSLANEPPEPDFDGTPKLTVKMTALIQGFPKDWVFTGKKTPSYRQVGNAFPPPVAAKIGESIIDALNKKEKYTKGIELELQFNH
jgi:DNA (cytosine-5)-methyltransferase 1